MLARSATAPSEVRSRRSWIAQPLGPLETVLMDLLWAGLPQTAIEMTSSVNAKKSHPISAKTVLTCLTRLEGKGLVAHHKEGRSYRFYATHTADETMAKYIGDEISQILTRFGDLAVAVLLDRLAQDPARLKHLRTLLEVEDERGHS
jgi:predicted transcriptional regulator